MNTKLDQYLCDIRVHLITTHAKVLTWFSEPEAMKVYRPVNGGWTIAEILEHISLTSHFLLILIDKGAAKALRNVKGHSLEGRLENYQYDLSRLDAIGQHLSFSWVRPEHMEPRGNLTELEIKLTLAEQLRRCLVWLDELKAGEGLLYETTMTVNELGKLNVYEYLYFLSKHAERHLQQMEKNKVACLNRASE